MQKSKPIIDQSLSELADERDAQAFGRSAAAVASWAVNIGLLISAILTVIYLMLLVDDAAGLPPPYGLLFGLLVGVVAIVPAELALVVWRARLASDGAITTGQRATAVAAMIAAGVFSALTTSSFFSYFLPQLFSPSYLAIAPALNVAAVVGSWIVFIMAVVAYSVFSRQTQQNLSQAKAFQAIFDARMSVLKSAGEAIRLESENMVTELNDRGVFREDAQNLILASLGMESSRLALPAKSANPSPPHEDDRQLYTVQEMRGGHWVNRVMYPNQTTAVEVAQELWQDAQMSTRVTGPDGRVIQEFDSAYEYDPSSPNGKRPVDLVDMAERQASYTYTYGNGNGANFTQRPGNGRGL